jgi:hypothetical protein
LGVVGRRHHRRQRPQPLGTQDLDIDLRDRRRRFFIAPGEAEAPTGQQQDDRQKHQPFAFFHHSLLTKIVLYINKLYSIKIINQVFEWKMGNA